MAAAARERDRRAEALSQADRSRETIFACSTGSAPAAIAIIRISGPAAGATIEQLTGRTLPRPRYAVMRTLRDRNGAVLDTALILWLPGPHTATGEDLAELHVHGGKATIAAVEAALAALDGLRPAEPGAFTRRAFDNGRLDLSQVEGLADLLAAESEVQRVAALALAEGGLRREVDRWQSRMLEIGARIEAAIDHDEEVDVDLGAVHRAIIELANTIEAVLAAPPAERLRDGIRVALAGPPNAGKSSLINVLAGRTAAIVSPIDGTTRDLIEVPVIFGGLPFVMVDTAGLRDNSEDVIERIGIARAEAAIAACDILLWLGGDDAPAHPCVIKLSPKSDLDVGLSGRLRISSVTGDGVETLRGRILMEARRMIPRAGQLNLSQHQRNAVNAAYKTLVEAMGESDIVIQAELLRGGRAALDRVTGNAGIENLLDGLFLRFCIGK